MKKIFLLIFLTLAVLSFSSCKSKRIDISVEVPFALDPDTTWARVISPYVSYREAPSYESSVSASGRKDFIGIVKGQELTEVNGRAVRWYLLEDGWLPEDDVKVFDNYLKASVY